MSNNYYNIIRYPVITEKATLTAENNKQYIFKVKIDANKNIIKKAIETIFNVKVLAVNTIIVKGKTKIFRGKLGMRNDYKKAIVTIDPNQTIDISIGV